MKHIHIKRIRFLVIPLLAVFMGIALLLPLSAGAAATATTRSGSYTQTVTNDPATVNGVSGVFNGALTITKFVTQNGQLMAVGTLSGTITTTTATGTTLATLTSDPVTVPITSASGSCQILYLHTGEINLNLLGLVIDIQPITITITAQQGSGNLLGNLLCAVANLLNGGAPLASLTGLLNQILAVL
jgi:hypothetical protein